MKNQSTKTLAFLGSLLLATTAAKADIQYDESQYDKSSFWYGYTSGVASLLCQLAINEMISERFAAELLPIILKKAEQSSTAAPFKQDFLNAIQGVKVDKPECARIFK